MKVDLRKVSKDIRLAFWTTNVVYISMVSDGIESWFELSCDYGFSRYWLSDMNGRVPFSSASKALLFFLRKLNPTYSGPVNFENPFGERLV